MPDEAEALKRAYADHALSSQDEVLVARSLVRPVGEWLEMVVYWLRQMVSSDAGCLPADRPLDSNLVSSLPGRIYLTGGGSLLPDLTQALTSLEANPSLNFRRSLEIEPLGLRLGFKASGQLPLLDVPPHPVSDLLASAISLATCLK